MKKVQTTIKFCLYLYYAERGGFEPPNRFRRLHAFQACLFSHSSTFPLSTLHGAKTAPDDLRLQR